MEVPQYLVSDANRGEVKQENIESSRVSDANLGEVKQEDIESKRVLIKEEAEMDIVYEAGDSYFAVKYGDPPLQLAKTEVKEEEEELHDLAGTSGTLHGESAHQGHPHKAGSASSPGGKVLGPAHIEPSPRTAHAQHTDKPGCGMGRGPHTEPSCWHPGWQMSALELLLDLESESDSDEMALLYLLLKRKRSKKKKYLTRRNNYGEFNLFQEVPDSVFKNSFRLSREQFSEIHELIKIDITGRECNAQKPIGSEEKLAVCLRYLATGDTFKTIALSYRMGERTVSKIVSEVCDAIWLRMQPIYMPEPTVEIWESIAMDFERKWQFYNCVGAIDGKHIFVRKPLRGKYKQYFSIVLMAAADAHYRFITVEVGHMGRFSDGNIFSSSSFRQKLLTESLHLPQPKPLPNQNEVTPFVFIGDEAFPLMPNLMRPYPKVKVTDNFENKVFNYRLCRARQSVKCAFGILSARFRVFKRPFECKLETIHKVVLATTVLHNYLRSKTLLGMNPSEEDDELACSSVETNFAQLSPNRTRGTRTAFLIREQFKDCFNSAQGSVKWQPRAGQY